MIQIEITYEKAREARYLAHLDLMRAFERAVRRAKIPVEYSQGFNPRPRIVHSSALGVGVTSECERACLRLARLESPTEIGRRLAAVLPSGLLLKGVREVPEGVKPNYALLDRAEYIVSLPAGTAREDELVARVEAFLAHDEVIVERKKEESSRAVDIRPLVDAVRTDGDDSLRIVVHATQEAQAKPHEVLAAMGLWSEGNPMPLIHRTRHFADRQRKRSAVRRR